MAELAIKAKILELKPEIIHGEVGCETSSGSGAAGGMPQKPHRSLKAHKKDGDLFQSLLPETAAVFCESGPAETPQEPRRNKTQAKEGRGRF